MAAGRFSGSDSNPGGLDVENVSSGTGRKPPICAILLPAAERHISGDLRRTAGTRSMPIGAGSAPSRASTTPSFSRGTAFDIGDIVVDLKVIARSGIDDTVTEVAVSSARMQKSPLGVVSRQAPLDPRVVLAALRRSENDATNEPTFLMRLLAEKYDLLVVNSVGEGQINVCGRNGDVEAGDLLITSRMRGKAERQDDDIVRAITVAKAREAVRFDHPDQVRRWRASPFVANNAVPPFGMLAADIVLVAEQSGFLGFQETRSPNHRPRWIASSGP